MEVIEKKKKNRHKKQVTTNQPINEPLNSIAIGKKYPFKTRIDRCRNHFYMKLKKKKRAYII
jgi:hypothetical protein